MTTAAAPTKKKRRLDFRPGLTAIKDLHVDLRLSEVLTERYSLAAKDKNDPFDTACWCFDKDSKRHLITFGHGITEHLKEGCEDKLEEYSKNYYRHEVAHSLWTFRDLKNLGDELNAKGLPFPLLNLLEDARIEHRWRSEYGGTFDWLSHEEPLVEPAKIAEGKPKPGEKINPQWAMDVLTTIIQNEGSHSIREPGGILGDLPEADAIWDFYGKLCAVPDQDKTAILDTVQQWAAQFGVPPNIPNGSSRAGTGDVEAASKAAKDPSKVGGTSPEQDAPGIGSKHDAETFSTGKVLSSRTCRSVSLERAERLARIIEQAFRFGDLREKSDAPGKRLSIRDVILNRPEIFLHQKKANAARGRIYVLIDNSGSMGGPPSDSAAHLALALGILARKGRLEGYLGFTKIEGTEARCENHPLAKIDEKLICRMESNGDAEGIAPALKHSLPLIVDADLMLCFTDGNVTDAPISPAVRSTLHKKGVYTIGMYVGDNARAPRLKSHFDYAVSRYNEVNLAMAVATLIRRYSLTHKRVYGESKDTALKREADLPENIGVAPEETSKPSLTP